MMRLRLVGRRLGLVALVLLASPTSVPARLAAANDEMAEYLRSCNTKLLGDVLYTSSNLMHNSFAMSDRWN